MSSSPVNDPKTFCENAIRNLINDLETKYSISLDFKTEFNRPVESQYSVDDFNSKIELKKKNLNDLKEMCKYFKLRYSGKKDDLVNRIWGVKHPEEAPLDSQPKKRGRKSKAITVDSESVQSSPQNSPSNSQIQSPINSPGNNDDGFTPVQTPCSSGSSTPLASP